MIDSQGPEAWYMGLPRFTRTFITIILGITLLSFFKVLDPSKLLLNWELVLQKFQIWRLVTSVLYVGPFSLRWIFFILLFSQFSSSLENNSVFTHSPGAYLYFLFIQSIFLACISAGFFWPSGYPYLADSLLFAIIYYWSKRDMWTIVSIYFFNVKAYQLPFALLFLHLVMGSSLWVDIMGMISGHLFYLAREVLPSKDRMYSQLFRRSTHLGGSRFRYDPRPPEPTGRMFIGRGIRLGDS
eukprot:XP_764400.1 hypothetical protein [Theileria parva strain Muguga]